MNIKVQRGHVHVSDCVGNLSPPVSTKDAPLSLNSSVFKAREGGVEQEVCTYLRSICVSSFLVFDLAKITKKGHPVSSLLSVKKPVR